MPPSYPNSSGEHLYNQLRPEFVQQYSIPLCSDAFTGFAKEDYEEHCDEICDAMDLLFSDSIDHVLENITKLPRYQKIDFSSEFHKVGLNMRYMGAVRWTYVNRILNEGMYRDGRRNIEMTLLEDMIARSLKSIIRKDFAEIQEDPEIAGENREELCILTFVTYVNLLMGPSKNHDMEDLIHKRQAASDEFWRDVLLPSVLEKYPLALPELETQDEISIRELADPWSILSRLLSTLKIDIGADFIQSRLYISPVDKSTEQSVDKESIENGSKLNIDSDLHDIRLNRSHNPKHRKPVLLTTKEVESKKTKRKLKSKFGLHNIRMNRALSPKQRNCTRSKINSKSRKMEEVERIQCQFTMAVAETKTEQLEATESLSSSMTEEELVSIVQDYSDSSRIFQSRNAETKDAPFELKRSLPGGQLQRYLTVSDVSSSNTTRIKSFSLISRTSAMMWMRKGLNEFRDAVESWDYNYRNSVKDMFERAELDFQSVITGMPNNATYGLCYVIAVLRCGLLSEESLSGQNRITIAEKILSQDRSWDENISIVLRETGYLNLLKAMCAENPVEFLKKSVDSFYHASQESRGSEIRWELVCEQDSMQYMSIWSRLELVDFILWNEDDRNNSVELVNYCIEIDQDWNNLELSEIEKRTELIFNMKSRLCLGILSKDREDIISTMGIIREYLEEQSFPNENRVLCIDLALGLATIALLDIHNEESFQRYIQECMDALEKLKLECDLTGRLVSKSMTLESQVKALMEEYRKSDCDLARLGRRCDVERRRVRCRLRLGNTVDGVHQQHELFDELKWSCFVELEREEKGDLIDHAVFHLHPSFAASTVVVREAPYLTRAVAWGDFAIRVSVFLGDPFPGRVLRLTHMLRLQEPLPVRDELIYLFAVN